MSDYSIKMTPEKVIRLRIAYWTKGYSQAELARHYNISATQVCQIVHRKSWPFLSKVSGEPS